MLKIFTTLRFSIFLILLLHSTTAIFAQCPPPPFPGYSSDWNVGVYKNGLNYNFSNYKGFYTAASTTIFANVNPTPPTVIGAGSFEFNTTTHGYGVGNPSNATGYQGCVTTADTFSLWAKKNGFDCGYYKIYLQYYDDDTRIRIDKDGDGTPEFTSSYTNPPCSTPGCNTVVWEGFLSSDSKVDIQAIDINLDFVVHWVFLKQPYTTTLTNNGPICLGQPVTLTANLLVNGVPKVLPSYIFVANGGPVSQSIVSPVNTAVFTPTVTPQDYLVFFAPGTVCFITESTTVTSSGTPATATNTGPKCAGSPVILFALPSGATSYAWSGPLGYTSTIQNPVINNISTLQAGDYTVTVTNGGCTSTAITTVVVNPAPTNIPNIPTPLPVCQASQVTLQIPPPVPATATYSWSGPNGFTSTNPTPTVTVPNCPGGCVYSVTITDGGCSVVRQVTLTTFQAVTFPPPSLGASNITVCPNGSASISVTGATAPFVGFVPLALINTIINIPVGSQLAYIWKDPNGNVLPNTTSTLNLSNVTVAGTYTVAFTYSNAGVVNTCSSTTTPFQVTLSSLSASASSTIICTGEPTVLTATGGAGIVWTPGNLPVNSVTVYPTSSVTYTATSSSGCTSSVAITVNTPTPVVVNASAMSICAGASTTISTSPTTYSNYNWSPSGSGSSFVATPTTNTTYSVTATDANGCTTLNSKAITVNPLPLPVITGSTSICNGGTSTLNAGANFDTYAWSGGQTTQTITVSAAGTYTVTVTKNNCSASASITVILSANLMPVIAGGGTFCEDVGTNLIVNGFSTYLWSNGSTSNNIFPTTSGTYTVTVTQNGCSGTATATVTYQAKPPFDVTPNSANVCQGQNATLTATPGFTGYQWFPSGGNTNVAVLAPSLQYLVSATDGVCNVAAAASVGVEDPPIVAITGSSSICTGQSTILDAGAGFFSYLWSNGATTQTISVNMAGTYNVTVTNSQGGCPGIASKTITLSANLSPTITGGGTFCDGSIVTLSAPGFTGYSWTGGSTSSSITPTISGTYAVTVTQNGCTGTASATVTFQPKPAFAVTPSTITICQGQSTTLATTTGFSGYQWSPTGGNSASANVTSAGTYTVTATDGVCNLSASANITVNVSPVPTITGSNTFCTGQSTTLSASTSSGTYAWSNGQTTQTISVNTAGTYKVTVTENTCTGTASITVTQSANLSPTITGGGTFCDGSIVTLSAPGFTGYSWTGGSTSSSITPTTSDTYMVTVTQNGCSGTASATVTFQAKPAFAVTPSTITICEGQSTTLAATTGFSGYQWSPSGGNSVSANITTAGQYTVTATDGVCNLSASANVAVNPKPNALINGNLSICTGVSTTLTASPGGLSYSWSNGSTTSTSTFNTIGQVSVTVTDANNCSDIATANISNAAGFNVVVTASKPTICKGETVTLQTSGGSSYLWENGNTTSLTSVTPLLSTTYSVTVTNSNNCTSVGQVTINVNQSPNITLPPSAVFCESDSVLVQTNPTNLGNYAWSNGKNTPSIYIKTQGTYTVIASDLNGCKDTAQVSVTQNNKPTVTINGSKTFCPGTNTTLDAGVGFSNYLWSNGATTASITLGVSGPISVSVTDSNGCKNSASANINVGNKLSLSISGKDFCSGSSTTLDAGPFKNYLWDNGATTQKINVTTAGKYCVTVSDGACTGDTCITIKENISPKVSILGKTNICAGETTKLSLNNVFTSNIWSFNNDLNSSISVGEGTYTVTVTDANTCTATAQTKVTATPLPVPVLVAPKNICENTKDSIRLTSKFTSYKWLPNNEISQNIGIAKADTYSVTVTNALGCTGTTKTVVDPAFPLLPIIQGIDTICEGQSTQFQGLGLFVVTYKWSNGDTTSYTTLKKSGIYTLSVTGLGCPATISKTLIVNTLPTVNIIGNTSICNNKPVILSVTGPDKYKWSNGNIGNLVTINQSGKVSVTATNPQGCTNTDTIIVTKGGSVTKIDTSICDTETLIIKGKTFDKNKLKDSITISSPNGCDSIFVVNVTLKPTLKIKLEGQNSVCSGQEVELSINANGYKGTFDVSYSANSAPLTVVKNLKDGDKIKVKPNGTTQYNVTFFGFTIPTCALTVKDTFTVSTSNLQLKANVTSNFGSFGVPCFDSKTGSAKVTVTNGNTPFSYSWSDGSTKSDITNLGAGKYKVTVTDDIGCLGVDSVLVTEPKNLTFDAKADSKGCKNKGSIVVSNIIGGNGPFLYSTLTQDFKPFTDKVLKINDLTTGNYIVYIKDTNGCIAESTVFVPQSQGLQFSLGADQSINLGDSIQLNASANFLIKSIKWNTKQFLSCDNCVNPMAKPTKNIIYSAIAKDSLGCLVSDSLKITVNKALNVFVPNAFSPNGDSNNDVFMVFGDAKFILNIKSFRVFDRWGNIVFSDFNFKPNLPAHGWDGTFRGQLMDSNVFSYAVEVEFLGGTTEVFKGDVTLMYE